MKFDCIVPVGDPHCGSRFGLMPPIMRTNDGSSVMQNKIQDFMWRKWIHATTRWLPEILGDARWCLVLQGDLVEGRHHANMELVDHDITVHARIAREVLGPLADAAAEVFCIRGTECHARTTESEIAEHLGATPDPDTDDHCWEQLQIRTHGILCHFKHHISTTMRPWTRGGPLVRALVQEQLKAIELNHEPPKVIVRAHAHQFDIAESTYGLAVVTGAWQGMTRFARRVTQASHTIPSMQVLDFRDMNDRYRGATPGLPRVHWISYRPAPDHIHER